MRVSEGAQQLQSFLFFGIISTSVGVIPFSLTPLTYQQFENMTKQLVEEIFTSVPPAASEG